MDYILQNKLSVTGVLFRFVNDELLPGTDIDPKKFWNGLSKYAHELAPKNKELLEVRENLQKQIDIWHKNKKGKKINLQKIFKFFKKNWLFKKREREISN